MNSSWKLMRQSMQRDIHHVEESQLAKQGFNKYGEAFDLPYQNYQLHLANVMMVATLLLGFTLTGTLLSVSVTGTESYSTTELGRFFHTALKSGTFSFATLMLAFMVSASANEKYISHGAHYALLTMYNCLLPIAAAEVTLFMSVLAFLVCLKAYVDMVYKGPDICPGLPQPHWYSHTREVRPLSSCGQIGDDLFIAANKTCKGHRQLPNATLAYLDSLEMTSSSSWSARSPQSDRYVLCSVFDWYVAKTSAWFGKPRSYYFVYDTQMLPHGVRREVGVKPWVEWFADEVLFAQGGDTPRPFKTALLFEVIDSVTTAYCDRDNALRVRDQVCNLAADEPKTSLEFMQACIQARQSFAVVDKCVAEAQIEVVKCHKVCDYDMLSWALTERTSDTYLIPISLFLFLGMLVRGWLSIRHICEVRHHRKKLRLMLSKEEDCSSSEDEQLDVPPRSVRRGQQRKKFDDSDATPRG
eukprot:TRINITY_DN50172_c0_g1_i1.p1 TRINITY_DN50172_c0_g1~~TRINITY_DN50172_c0_g1_i1.p1  ORF type:complete len:470 (+),score=51.53 TRINITY_DN50172_c0_g1_i1:135-1544(+)